MRIKGPAFQSFTSPPSASSDWKPKHPALAGGKSWLSHCGRRARLRLLRQRCRTILQATDEPTVQARERINSAVDGEPDTEYAALHLMASALDASEGTAIPWHQSADYLIGKFASGFTLPEVRPDEARV